jgi:hypothetical protein
MATALATIAATPALARVPSHVNHARHLYMYSEVTPGAVNPGPGVNATPPGIKRRGYLITDPDPLIRFEILRGYGVGSTD